MALKYSYHGVIDGNIRMSKWRITLRKRNTYVVKRNQLQNEMEETRRDMWGNTTQYLLF